MPAPVMQCLFFLCGSALLLAGGCARRNLMTVKGSDTMLEAAQAWREAYAAVQPELLMSVSGGGSGPGVKDLIDGNVDIANSSRKLKKEELARAGKRGSSPVEYHVGYDAIAIYVHRDNPIQSITLEQLAGIYQDGGALTKWSDLGVSMPQGRDDRIIVMSRQNNSGTYEYFKHVVMHGQDYRLGTMAPNGSTELVSQVAATRNAIGYCGLAYATDRVKLVPVAKQHGQPAVVPGIDSAIDGSYPIARPLFMYTGATPRPEVKQYIDWILSDAGQRVLADARYPPLRKVQ